MCMPRIFTDLVLLAMVLGTIKIIQFAIAWYAMQDKEEE